MRVHTRPCVACAGVPVVYVRRYGHATLSTFACRAGPFSCRLTFSLTVEVSQRGHFTQWIIWRVWADLNLPGPLADREAAAPLFDKTRQQSSRLDWYAPPLDSLRFRSSG